MGFSQLYVALGDEFADGSVVVRMWWKPMVTLIWLGGLVMMIGGAVSLTDRRLRVGAPTRARATRETEAGRAMKRSLRITIAAIACIDDMRRGPCRSAGRSAQNPALEGRARALSEELRCMVCQNQSIDQSDADLARDLRILVRERLKAGDTDEQVLDYVVSRYGEFVLLKPRFSLRNALCGGRRWCCCCAAGRRCTMPLARGAPPMFRRFSEQEKQALEAILRRTNRRRARPSPRTLPKFHSPERTP